MRRGGRTLSAIHQSLPCPLTLPVVPLNVALPVVVAVVVAIVVTAVGAALMVVVVVVVVVDQVWEPFCICLKSRSQNRAKVTIDTIYLVSICGQMAQWLSVSSCSCARVRFLPACIFSGPVLARNIIKI